MSCYLQDRPFRQSPHSSLSFDHGLCIVSAMNELTPEAFDALIGQDFVVTNDDGAQITMSLTAVSRLETGAPATDIDGNPLRAVGFQLTLRGPAQPLLATQAYPVDIPGLGQHHLLMSAFEVGRTAVNYDIAFA
jgi:hypothetical protein